MTCILSPQKLKIQDLYEYYKIDLPKRKYFNKGGVQECTKKHERM